MPYSHTTHMRSPRLNSDLHGSMLPARMHRAAAAPARVTPSCSYPRSTRGRNTICTAINTRICTPLRSRALSSAARHFSTPSSRRPLLSRRRHAADSGAAATQRQRAIKRREKQRYSSPTSYLPAIRLRPPCCAMLTERHQPPQLHTAPTPAATTALQQSDAVQLEDHRQQQHAAGRPAALPAASSDCPKARRQPAVRPACAFSQDMRLCRHHRSVPLPLSAHLGLLFGPPLRYPLLRVLRVVCRRGTILHATRTFSPQHTACTAQHAGAGNETNRPRPNTRTACPRGTSRSAQRNHTAG